MGYYVNLEHSDVVLKNEDLQEILQIWKDLNAPENNHLKRGGSWSGGQQNDVWYSWMDADYDKKVSSVQDVLQMLGFDYEIVEEGIAITGYDNKIGQEDLFFSEISKFIPPEQTMNWRGEDGECFIWIFKGGKLKSVSEEDYSQLQKIDKKSEEQVTSKKKTFKHLL